MPETALFPARGLNASSIILYLKDGFGFEKFDNLFVAGYTLGDAETTAFLTVRESAAAAAALAEAYAGFLTANGGVEEPTAGADSWARMFNLFGTYEVVLVCGKTVAGIHEAENRELAEELGSMLHDHLSGRTP